MKDVFFRNRHERITRLSPFFLRSMIVCACAFFFICDRWTKSYAFFLRNEMVVIPHLLSFRFYAHEHPFLLGFSMYPVVVFFAVLCLCVALFVTIHNNQSPVLFLGVMLIVSGATSNLVDVVAYGAVIDWIFIFGISIFNLSDVAIVAGCGSIMYSFLF